MARQPSPKSGVTKVRFMLLEAEGTESDLSQIFSAIQSAVKPATTIIQQRLAPTAGGGAVGLIDQTPAAGEATDEEQVDFSEDEAQQPAAQSARPSKPRKPTVPKVVEADLTSGISLEAFANEHPVSTDLERNLVIAAWFKEHRGEDAITSNHVFTGYKSLGWPFGIPDFAAPLRKLKGLQLVENKGRGSYAINHLGIARVSKLGKDSA